MNLDPIETSDSVVSTYAKYLGSLLPLRDLRLRGEIRRKLMQPGTVAQGPLLEATPPFRTGASLSSLVEEGVLSPALSRMFSDALPGNRPLYLHQEDAIRKAQQGSNLVIATGTGSGKTESFLVPILNHLAEESRMGTLGPGVRAILLYPMNALANDQLKRMRSLLGVAPEITFGRYTGETKYQSQALDHYRMQNGGEDPLPNELISREQMQETPPHILLTNYAMLEYLLLRPADLTLFEGTHGNHWKYVVVDEAHVYDGVQGAEIAMLLRRLRDRVSRERELQYFASSATVGDEMAKVASFGSALFGAPFTWVEADPHKSSVVEAARHPIRSTPTWGPLSPDHFRALAEAPDPETLLEQFAGGALEDEVTVRKLLSSLNNGPQQLRDLAEELFPAEESFVSARALVDLVDVSHRIAGHHGRPTLSARYHLFVSAVEGAYTCLGPDGPHVEFARHKTCPTCNAPAFEVAACKRCGTLHIPGTLEKKNGLDYLIPLDGNTGKVHWALVADTTVAEDEDDEAHLDSGGEDRPSDEATLCTACAAFGPSNATRCLHCDSADVRAVVRRDAGRELNHCQGCGARSMRQVRRLSSGSDATAAVLASALYEHLPADPHVSHPGQGRRLLMFSDSRQQAAFAAPYLELSYGSMLQRALIARGLKRMAGEELSSTDVLAATTREASKAEIFDYDITGVGKRVEVATWIHRELLEGDERTSLEGTGLIAVRFARPRQTAPSPLLALGLTSDESWDLLDQLVQTLRIQGAVSPVEDNVDLASEALAPRNRAVYVREHQSDRRQSVLSWVPSARSTGNRRSDYLGRVLAKLGSDAPAEDLLPGIWRLITSSDRLGWLEQIQDKRRGVVYRVNPEKLRWQWAEGTPSHFRCSLCQRYSSVNVRGVCPTNGCRGTLAPSESIDPEDHYARVYLDLAANPLRAEEHTAQLTGDVASQVQQEFVDGQINVLSCSTTFELGVDVGELQSVFLRNVPPSTANYVQRAGRAGRRTDSAALVLTFAQMRSHDQAMFQHPTNMIQGTVRAPVVVDDNARVDRRHAHSIVISAFFRNARDQHQRTYRTVQDFFSGDAPTGLELLEAFLTPPSQAEVEAIRRVLPASVHGEIGLDDGTWVPTLLDLVRLAGDEYLNEANHYDEQREQAANEQKYPLAAALQRVSRTVNSQPLIGYFARKNILPKYGFPVDTVELRVPGDVDPQSATLDLSRDLAIAVNEYAPGNAIVARGKLIESGGIYTLPGRDLPRRHYAVCRECRHLDTDFKPLGPTCSACGASRTGARREFIRPQFGFVSTRQISKVGLRRPSSPWTSEMHILEEGALLRAEVLDTRIGPVKCAVSALASMCVLNEGTSGTGFLVCDWCGWAGPVVGQERAKGTKHSHDSPRTGQKCAGYPRVTSLAHDYQTDILVLEVPGLTGEDQKRSVLYALLAGSADALEISRDDLDGTLLPSRGDALVIFDTVAGGAGLVRRIAESLSKVVDAAISRVESCECGLETSCHRCLRVYRNQKYHPKLRRELVLAAVTEG